MKYNDLTMDKLRKLSILEVAEKLGFELEGTGDEGRRTICPYHEDKHPSMHFSKKKGIFKCFVCGAKGDLFKLVMDDRNCSFVEACDWLIDEFKVVVVPDVPALAPKVVASAVTACEKKEAPASSVLVPLDIELVNKSLSAESVFCKSVVAEGYLSKERLMTAVNRYRLGASKEGGVIFWEIDDRQRVRTGKIMYYKPDCHRDKNHTPTWVHSLMKSQLPADYELQHCLFGLHLISPTDYTNHTDKKVAIVEAEKTAVIMSEIVPEFIWMSCGGLQMFNAELLAPLVNHKVVILPDTDETGEAYNKWLTVLKQAQRQYVFKYPLRISRLLEDHASAEQKKRKIDIIDFLYEQ